MTFKKRQSQLCWIRRLKSSFIITVDSASCSLCMPGPGEDPLLCSMGTGLPKAGQTDTNLSFLKNISREDPKTSPENLFLC